MSVVVTEPTDHQMQYDYISYFVNFFNFHRFQNRREKKKIRGKTIRTDTVI